MFLPLPEYTMWNWSCTRLLFVYLFLHIQFSFWFENYWEKSQVKFCINNFTQLKNKLRSLIPWILIVLWHFFSKACYFGVRILCKYASLLVCDLRNRNTFAEVPNAFFFFNMSHLLSVFGFSLDRKSMEIVVSTSELELRVITQRNYCNSNFR